MLTVAKQIHFKCIDSTNSWAKAHTEQWAPQGVTLVTASEQSAGRGRFKRKWISPPDVNLYATFCLWFDLQRNDMGHIPQLLSLAAAIVLEKEGFSPTIKWPNDLLLNGKKVGGILCETSVEGERKGVICGIGLNVNMQQEELMQIDRPATSLLVEGKYPLSVEAIRSALAAIFVGFLVEFTSSGFQPFFPLFQERSYFKKGDVVHFHDNLTLIEGNFETLHSDGSVAVKLQDGTTRIFHAGEFI